MEDRSIHTIKCKYMALSQNEHVYKKLNDHFVFVLFPLKNFNIIINQREKKQRKKLRKL
jgi:hypothetical protein